MKEFNYQDYLKYQKLKEIEENNTYKLCEPETKYHVHQPHDKIFKTVLNEKSQMVALLNRVLQLKVTLSEDDIEKHNIEHMNYMFQNSESDVIYKMKKKEIFFLIEHQRQIDYNMPKRILEYEVEIIKEAVKGKTMTKKEHTLPRVIPIVIYTGSGKWNVEKYIEECQEKLESEGESMVLEVIRKENENLIRQGRKEGKLEILKQSVKNMLQLGEDEEKIMKYVGINKKELDNIKSML